MSGAAPGPDGDPVLDLAHVFHSYGQNVVLRDVSLRVARGEFLTLLGPSGSGKSTLLRIVAGLEDPDSVERMELHGRDIVGLPPNLRNVSTVFQHYALFPHMSVGENVEYGLKVRKVPPAPRRAQAEAALALVRLPDKYDRRIHQLSGGERQRVALARSLALQPDVLLLDEPLGALDERLRLDMQVELIDIRKKTGGTFILVTHSQEEAITMSDRIVLMRAGTIEQIADPKTLFESPRTAFAARFMGVENVLEGRLDSVAGGRATVRVGDTVLHGRPVGDLATAGPGARVFAAIRAEHMRFAEPGTTGPNRLAGTPGTAIYKGKFRDIPFSSAVGTVVVRQWDTDRAMPAEGEVEFNADHCVVGVLEQDDVA
ncbi:MAG TPA: ABC transporter ATP-binding protein [Bauldia sp.]|nr:ABC transporter ATP-binding protein [Bauldia sp.]